MKLSIIFPGQGSQSVGMLGELAARYKVVAQTFAEAAEQLGYDLWQLVSEGPAERLNDTLYTQPAMLASGVAVWRCWQEQGGADPALLAGHSLGEFTALVCAGALSFADALQLTTTRARLMQAAVPAGSGAMAAIIGLSGPQVAQLCTEQAAAEVLEPANFNAPMQTVIAGHLGAVQRGMEAARVAGARRALLLPVSVPSHCSLMRDAARQLAGEFAASSWKQPGVPVLHNVDAALHPDVEGLQAALSAQLHRPVRWLEVMRGMVRQGAELLLEFGPGRVLTNLGRQISTGLTLLSVNTPGGLDRALEKVSE